MNMWDETLAISYCLRNSSGNYRIQPSRAAWTYRFRSRNDKVDNRILDDWDKSFMQRNLSYFFSAKEVTEGRYGFERGLSCYADSALTPDEDMRARMQYYPERPCMLLMLPFDVNKESFEGVFGEAMVHLEKEGKKLCGDPWGNLGYRDERIGISTEYLFMWLPIE